MKKRYLIAGACILLVLVLAGGLFWYSKAGDNATRISFTASQPNFYCDTELYTEDGVTAISLSGSITVSGTAEVAITSQKDGAVVYSRMFEAVNEEGLTIEVHGLKPYSNYKLSFTGGEKAGRSALFLTTDQPLVKKPETPTRPKHDKSAEDDNMGEYRFPAEDMSHEGTWLNWPHQYTYGIEYRQELEPIWVTMTAALHKGENVHIVVYDEKERTRVEGLLASEQLDMEKIDFVVAKSDDVWSRDTGPIFVLDGQGKAVIADFAFDGWGGKVPFENDDKIPQAAAEAKGIPLLDIPEFVLEGGSVELDGNGTAMLCKSSVVSENRNPGKSVAEAERVLARYLGVTNFIWLEGVVGEDITDSHIDGMARFYGDDTLLTVSEDDFFELYEGIEEKDYEALFTAKNAHGAPYEIVELPLTAKNVKGLDYKGSYLNFYVGNEVVLVPVYGDKNDAEAIKIIHELYTDREVVPIDVTALYQYGGMLHCVTQQQPNAPQIPA